jgi:RNA polymerase sigma-70 factor (ECF subfamily)
MNARERFDATIAEARAGDRAALERLYRDLHPPILRYLRALEPGEGEDLASEVWLDVITSLQRFRGDERGFRAWAFTIARSRLVDLRRRRSRRATTPTSPDQLDRLDRSRNVEEEALAGLATEEALRRIAALNRDQAEVVLLRVLGGLAVRDVGAIMGKRPGTIRVLQHRALRKLAEQVTPVEVTE